jgi:predicted porin
MSLAVFDGNTFIDLSGELPDQMDAILYANAWNGKLWLIGGGYDEVGELLSYNGSTLEDLTDQVTQAIPSFGSVQSIAWNGDYWLIGGVNFLAKYDGNEFLDLSPELSSAMNWREGWGYSVNAVAWNGVEWMLGGGSPVAQFSDSNAWVASYSSSRFENLSPKLGTTVANDIFQSSVLTIAPTGDSWIIGGYANDHGILYSYRGSDFTQLFNLVSNYTYVNWVGAGSLPNHTDASKVNRSTFDFTSCQLMTNIEKRVHVLLPVML